MLLIRYIIAAATLLAPFMAIAAPLTVSITRNDLYAVVSGDSTRRVFISGTIERGATARVLAQVEPYKQDGLHIYLDSPGGNLLEGLELGRAFRKLGANTDIGKPGIKDEVLPAQCLSSCSLAYLGGIYRNMTTGSSYGVHRMSSAAGPSSSDLDVAQILSAAVAAYIREMNVSTELFDLMVQAGKDQIYILSEQQLKQLYVVNYGRQPPEWTIEAAPGGQYLRGTQDTRTGLGRMIFICTKKTLLFRSDYETGADRANQIRQGAWVHSLMINHKTLPLRAPTKITMAGDMLNSYFVLSSTQAKAIANAHASIGHAMQVSREAPSFVGYWIDLQPVQQERVSNYINNCLNGD